MLYDCGGWFLMKAHKAARFPFIKGSVCLCLQVILTTSTATRTMMVKKEVLARSSTAR